MKVLTAEFKDLDDYMKKYGPTTNIEAWASTESVTAFFEGVGVLLHNKLINLGLVDDLLSSPIKYTWEKIEPLVKERRKRRKRPQIWEWFEYLYNEMQKREQTLQPLTT